MVMLIMMIMMRSKGEDDEYVNSCDDGYSNNDSDGGDDSNNDDGDDNIENSDGDDDYLDSHIVVVLLVMALED